MGKSDYCPVHPDWIATHCVECDIAEHAALRHKLAASQARERALRVAFENAPIHGCAACRDSGAPAIANINAALTLPSDDTALRDVCLRVAAATRDAIREFRFERFNADADELCVIVDEVLKGQP